MEKIKWIALLAFLWFPFEKAGGFGRSGNLADQKFRNEGNRREAFSVFVDSVSAVQVYDSFFSGYIDRSIIIENTNPTFNVYCGTHPFVSASFGPRFLLPPKPDRFKTYSIYDIYCIADPLAEGNQIELLGEITYDTKD